ncbi:MAG: HAD-IIIA family hydrolase [Alphaproteobacteria bacterium]|nr:HAD-IIIA family hydrolase [Alphaproteobacteria bacterium]
MLVLLDRDGVLNRERADFVKTVEEVVMIPGSAAAVARLNRAGHRVAVVTNQSVVGRGLIDAARLDAINRAVERDLAAHGGHLDLLLACTDPPWAPSARRKPQPGMLLEAMAHFSVPAAETVMIGDSLRDMESAVAAGCARVLVRTGNGRACEAAGLPAGLLPCPVVDDLAAAVGTLIGTPP